MFFEQQFEIHAKEIEVLKEEVRALLLAPETKLEERMNLINTIERLGISYHFEKEIEEQLEQIFHSQANSKSNQDHDLCQIALQFRIFRQHGYNISCDVFRKFKDSNGRFKESLAGDIMGMLSLYEAAYVRTHGEDVLDEAVAFTTIHLESMRNHLDPAFSRQATHALKQPLHRGIPRAEARHYISFYQEMPSKNELLLKLAKIDFNLLQMMHKQELCHLSRWWKDLDFELKLPYLRSRVVVCYLWALTAYFQPCYSNARIMLTKVIVMISIMDDTYDAYGKLDELKSFTEAVNRYSFTSRPLTDTSIALKYLDYSSYLPSPIVQQFISQNWANMHIMCLTIRWDASTIDQLPDYMKICYRALLSLYEDFEKQMEKKGRSYAVYCSKNAFKEVVNSYYVEAKWFNEGCVPPFDEYVENALISCGNYPIATTSLMDIGEIATVEAFDWVQGKPKILVASNKIVRFMDDIADYEDDKRRGHDATGIECYMKEHGVSKEEAVKVLHRGVEDAWKDINEEFLKLSCVPKHLLVIVLNLTRIMDALFKDEDGYTHPEGVTKDYVESVLINPIPI